MVTAYAMVITAAGRSTHLVEDIRAIDGVVDAHVIAGDFDIMVEIDARSIHAVREVIVDRIQSLEGIGTTRTYLALDED